MRLFQVAVETCGNIEIIEQRAMDDLRMAADECKKLAEAEGEEWPELEFEYIFDLGSFFDYFPLNASAFAKRIGINPVLTTTIAPH